jgi:hypothetical protein
MADLFWSEATWPMATRSLADADEVAQAVRNVFAEVSSPGFVASLANHLATGLMGRSILGCFGASA